ncbi:MAG: threonine-phosphate decarboxylase [Rhodoblastus sp.]|nr:threonine-phosphate decarboxylase [Rhodoblastus sp.]
MLHARPAPDECDAMAPLDHGGDLSAARRRFPDAPEPWIDLSTGINPHAYPVGALPEDCFARLPEPAALRALEATAAHAYGVADAHTIIAAAGAQALIQALPRILPGRRIGVLTPTYAEHAASWRRAGREVVACADVTQLATCDIAVVVNPNNPTGRVITRDALLALARRTLLIVDESFADLAPGEGIAGEATACGAIVLRSFGKTYGLAGVRLGFAIAPLDIAARLRDAFGPWPVSGPAITLGARALGERDWLEATRRRLVDDAARLDALLRAAGFEIVGGTPLFRLAAHIQAQAIADQIGRAGVLVRRFVEHPHWLRFGIPADGAWARLETALGGSP